MSWLDWLPELSTAASWLVLIAGGVAALVVAVRRDLRDMDPWDRKARDDARRERRNGPPRSVPE